MPRPASAVARPRFALFSASQPAPQGTVGGPFQRATPTRRAPPGAVGTLPPPPGRPVVPGLLWAHYMPALFVDSGQNKGMLLCQIAGVPEMDDEGW